MIETRTIGSLTEIYAGGGNFLTQSRPTNYPVFITRKVLTPKETIDDWREVTTEQKTTLEKAAAAFVPPSEEFLAEVAVTGCGAITYDAATGYFAANGITDLTETDVRRILAHGRLNFATPAQGGTYNRSSEGSRIRTNLLTASSDGMRSSYMIDLTHAFYNQSLIEVAVMGASATAASNEYTLSPVAMTNAFIRCSRLRKIDGRIRLDKLTNTNFNQSFSGCTALETINFSELPCSIAFKDCPKLSLESIEYMVANAANTKPITITLHADAFARLTEELIAEAAEKQITFATA